MPKYHRETDDKKILNFTELREQLNLLSGSDGWNVPFPHFRNIRQYIIHMAVFICNQNALFIVHAQDPINGLYSKVFGLRSCKLSLTIVICEKRVPCRKKNSYNLKAIILLLIYIFSQFTALKYCFL